jgi:hypothetical protein
MGAFMTASEANRQRVLRLVRFEREQTWEQFTTVNEESPAFAGLWETWKDKATDQAVDTYTVE